MRTISVTIAGGSACPYEAESLWQWDYGQNLEINGLILPEYFEVHFTDGMTLTKTQIGHDNIVHIPDEYLTKRGDVHAYIFGHETESDGETEYHIVIPVRLRTRPSVYEPTDIEADAISQAIAALQASVVEVAGSAEEAAENARSAGDAAAAAAESALDAQTAEDNAGASALAAEGAASRAADSADAAAASAKDLSDAVEAAQDAASAALASAGDAEGYRDAALAAKSDAVDAKTNAETAASQAVSAKNDAVSAKTAAQSAATDAGSAKTAAQTAQGLAESARDAAVSAKEDAEDAATAAQTAQGLAEGARDDAVSAKGDAEAAAIALSSAVEQVEANTEAIADIEANYAHKDGAYPAMLVGNLLTSVGPVESVPYNYRTAGGSLEIGETMEDLVVGGSVVWNQLLENGDFADTSKWVKALGNISASNNELTYTITSIGSAYYSNYVGTGTNPYRISIPSGHVVYLNAETYAPYNNGFYMSVRKNSVGQSGVGITNVAPTPNAWSRFSKIGKTTDIATDIAFMWSMDTNYAVGDSVKLRNCFVIDLTLAFGTTIADYIYSLETATPGAGVAWLKRYSPAMFDRYNPYAAPDFVHVQTEGHRMTALNQWDEVWELGSINVSTGENSSSSTTIRSKNYTPVFANTNYCLQKGVANGTMYIVYYDADKKKVGNTDIANSSAKAIKETPEGTCYLRFFMASAYGTTYKNDICINLSYDGERDGEYEPYREYLYPLDSSLTLRGIPKLDANNQLYYDGDTYASDGTVTRKYGAVNLGALTWTEKAGTGKTFFHAPQSELPGAPAFSQTSSILKAMLYGANYSWGFQNASTWPVNTILFTGVAGTVPANSLVIVTEENAYADAATFKASMANVFLVYELATHVEEQAEPYTNPQSVDNFGTEEYIDSRSLPLPVGHTTRYNTNLRAKIETAPNPPSGGNGDYLVRQTDGENVYVPFVKELPAAPAEAGTYSLRLTVAGGTASYAWVAE